MRGTAALGWLVPTRQKILSHVLVLLALVTEIVLSCDELEVSGDDFYVSVQGTYDRVPGYSCYFPRSSYKQKHGTFFISYSSGSDRWVIGRTECSFDGASFYSDRRDDEKAQDVRMWRESSSERRTSLKVDCRWGAAVPVDVTIVLAGIVGTLLFFSCCFLYSLAICGSRRRKKRKQQSDSSSTASSTCREVDIPNRVEPPELASWSTSPSLFLSPVSGVQSWLGNVSNDDAMEQDLPSPSPSVALPGESERRWLSNNQEWPNSSSIVSTTSLGLNRPRPITNQDEGCFVDGPDCLDDEEPEEPPLFIRLSPRSPGGARGWLRNESDDVEADLPPSYQSVAPPRESDRNRLPSYQEVVRNDRYIQVHSPLSDGGVANFAFELDVSANQVGVNPPTDIHGILVDETETTSDYDRIAQPSELETNRLPSYQEVVVKNLTACTDA